MEYSSMAGTASAQGFDGGVAPQAERGSAGGYQQPGGGAVSPRGGELQGGPGVDALHQGIFPQGAEGGAGGEATEQGAQVAAFSPDQYQIALPETFPAELHDPAVVERFTSFCASAGVSPEQAQKAVDFYMAEQASAMSGMHEHCETTLRSQWKEQYGARLASAKQACVSLDRQMQGRLMPLVNAGLGNNPVFAELMAKVGERITEDSFGHTRGAAPREEAMSTEEFLRKVVFRNK